MGAMRFFHIARCRTCDVKLPKLGDGGCIGMPTASRLPGHEFDPAPFGAIYEGLAAANLMNETLDRYLETLKKHRSHKLELLFKDHPDEDPDLTGPWNRASEAKPSPDFRKGYVRAWYGAACERCGRAFVSKDREKLRRFEPTALTVARIRKYFGDVSVIVTTDLDNPAAPLTPKELRKLGTFLMDHRAHGVRVALLTTPAEHAAFLPGKKKTSARKKSSPGPVRNLDDWWARLQKSGWLGEVPQAEADRIRQAAAAYSADVSQAFHALSPAGFDAECIEDSGDYERCIISSYRKASSGAFAPTNIKDRLRRSKATAVISFEAAGRKFSREFPQDDDYVADGVHDFLNDALAELGEQRRFHLLPTGDQTGAIVFVTPATYQRAIEAGLIPEGA